MASGQSVAAARKPIWRAMPAYLPTEPPTQK